MTLIEFNRMQLVYEWTNDWKNLSTKLRSHKTTMRHITNMNENNNNVKINII